MPDETDPDIHSEIVQQLMRMSDAQGYLLAELLKTRRLLYTIVSSLDTKILQWNGDSPESAAFTEQLRKAAHVIDTTYLINILNPK